MIRRAQSAIGVVLVATTGCGVRGTDIEPIAPPAARLRCADAALASTRPVDAWWTTFRDAR